MPAYNLSGSVVSIIDEEQLRNPLRPKVGDAIVAISGKPNPRSNGITAKRKIMIDRFGLEWHTTPEGKDYIEYLGEPSIVLYPVFRELLDRGLATSFYHMSGGAYEGKLAQPLAKEGLFARLEGLFEPDRREEFFVEASGMSVRDAYRKWPMGNDGFITTINPEGAINLISSHGYKARRVGIIARAIDSVSLEIEAYNGETISLP